MRPLIVMAALVWSPAFVGSPPLCTLPAPGAIPIAEYPAEEPAKPSPPAASADTPSPLPEALASMPFVRHVASAGAVVRDLGSSHGMRAIAARSGDQFMLFQVTPDGQAAVSGATVELSPAQLDDDRERQYHRSRRAARTTGLLRAQRTAIPGLLRDTRQRAADPRCHVGCGRERADAAAGRAHSRRDPNRGGRRRRARAVELRRS